MLRQRDTATRHSVVEGRAAAVTSAEGEVAIAASLFDEAAEAALQLQLATLMPAGREQEVALIAAERKLDTVEEERELAEGLQQHSVDAPRDLRIRIATTGCCLWTYAGWSI